MAETAAVSRRYWRWSMISISKVSSSQSSKHAYAARARCWCVEMRRDFHCCGAVFVSDRSLRCSVYQSRFQR